MITVTSSYLSFYTAHSQLSLTSTSSIHELISSSSAKSVLIVVSFYIFQEVHAVMGTCMRKDMASIQLL